MARNICFLIVLPLTCFAFGAWAQRSPYSLQTAVDELHHWDAAKFPLNAPPPQSSYYRSALADATDQDYWEDENTPSSIFRERDSQSSNGNTDMREKFFRAIEEVQEREQEQRYKNAIRHLLEKYQQQDNDVDNELFNEKKRMRVPPYYMLMQKKRSVYPVLPWLPYKERKKRFPVTKRSTKHSSNDNGNLDKTNESVEKELSELFGLSNSDAKKKRSTDDQTKTTTTNAPTAPSTDLIDMRLEMPTKPESNATESVTNIAPSEKSKSEHNHISHQHGFVGVHDGHDHEHKHNKRSNHRSNEDARNDSEEEDEEESDEHAAHGPDDHGDEHEDEDDDDDFGDEEDDERKKKRDVDGVKKSATSEVHNAKRKKKSIQWSKYFGIDRKKKASQVDKKFIKRSASDEVNDKEEDQPNLSNDKLSNMDKKLQSIEDMIIDETIKYTGAHEGITNPDEIRRLKDHVLTRLATAYSLEKMRLALDKLRQSVDNENHLLRNVIEAEPCTDDDCESAEFPNHLITKKEKSVSDEKPKQMEVSSDNTEMDKKHKKKRTNFQRYPELSNNMVDIQNNGPSARYEPLNDMYLGNKNYIVGSNQCPLIESMAERCRGVDILKGDYNQDLLPICGVHQICYLCGTSQISCDYQYLAEADAICRNNESCQAAARSILMILRGSAGPQLGPRECGKSPCLYSAMREIGL